MKILYIESKKKLSQEDLKNLASLDTKSLPKELFLAYSIQYKAFAEALRNKLKREGFKIKGFQQVLGCTKLNKDAIKQNIPILLVGSGRFHAINLALQIKAPIYIYNGTITKLDEKEVQKLRQKLKAALNFFLNSKNIGILVSTKPGQENLKKAQKLKEKIQKAYPEKQVFIFISNTINLNELENFQIDFWINTACPGLSFETQENIRLANADDIPL